MTKLAPLELKKNNRDFGSQPQPQATPPLSRSADNIPRPSAQKPPLPPAKSKASDTRNNDNDKLLRRVLSLGMDSRHMKELDLSGLSQLTHAGLAHLAGMTHLESLNLSGCHALTDESLRHLAGMTAMRSLDLSDCGKITGQGLRHLDGMREMRSLRLSDVHRIADADFSHFQKMTHLELLDLFQVNHITGEGLRHLKGITTMKTLILKDCQGLIGENLRHISGMRDMRELDLTGCRLIDGAAFAHIGEFSAMERLSLSDSNFTNDCLPHLSKMKNLKALSLFNMTSITTEKLHEVLLNMPALQWLDTSGCSGVSLPDLARNMKAQGTPVLWSTLKEAEVCLNPTPAWLASVESTGTIGPCP